MHEKLNRLRNNAANSIRQTFTMRKNNAADDDESTETEPNTEEIEDGLVPDEVVEAVETDVIGMVAVTEDIPRDELLQGDPEEVKALAREVATSLSAADAVELMADPAFDPDVDAAVSEAVEDATGDGSGVVGEDRAVYDGGEDAADGEETRANYSGVPGSVDRTNYASDERDPDGDDVSPGSYSGWRGDEDKSDGPGAGTLSDWEDRQAGSDDASLARTPWQKKQMEKRRRGREMRLNAARRAAARKARDGE